MRRVSFASAVTTNAKPASTPSITPAPPATPHTTAFPTRTASPITVYVTQGMLMSVRLSVNYARFTCRGVILVIIIITVWCVRGGWGWVGMGKRVYVSIRDNTSHDKGNALALMGVSVRWRGQAVKYCVSSATSLKACTSTNLTAHASGVCNRLHPTILILHIILRQQNHHPKRIMRWWKHTIRRRLLEYLYDWGRIWLLLQLHRGVILCFELYCYGVLRESQDGRGGECCWGVL